MFDEPYKNLMDSLAGIYRAYYELVSMDETYLDRYSIVIVSDGYDVFNKIESVDENGLRFAERLAMTGIYDEELAGKYVKRNQSQSHRRSDQDMYEYVDLNFINSEGDIAYETHNMAHLFSKKMRFTDFLKGMSSFEQSEFQVDKYSINDFMLGDSKEGRCKYHIFQHLAIDVHFVIKHQNRGKIESHLWFFKGFWDTIKPEYCFTVDTGTIPLWNSISRMVFQMENNPQIGGAWGEIEVMINEKHVDGTPISFIEGILLRAQYAEYKISHYLDKSTESLFGFVTVLQGAFAAYRWEAIKGKPLEKFLKGQELTDSKRLNYPSCSTANMYLTEDRIMWLQLITKQNENFILKYMHGCRAITDAPQNLSRLIKQRRRWNNGAMFVAFQVVFSMCNIWARKHSFFRNIVFSFLYIFMILQLIISYFMVGIYYTAFRILLRSMFESDNCISVTQVSGIIENLYMLLIFFILILSAWIRIDWAEWAFKMFSVIIAIMSLFMFASSVFYILRGGQAFMGVLLFWSIIFIYFFAMLLHIRDIRICDFIKGIIYLLFLSPTYINIMTIYSVANIHDITWGSRGESSMTNIQSQRDKIMEKEYKNYRSNFLIAWWILNSTVGGVVSFMTKDSQELYLFLIAFVFSIIVGTKFVFSTIYLIMTKCNNYSVDRFIKSKKGMDFPKSDHRKFWINWLIFLYFFISHPNMYRHWPNNLWASK